MNRKTYVFHCDKCCQMIPNGEYRERCPRFKVSKIDGFPMTVGVADYKQDRNYPQYVPNLGEVVTSYQDYERKLKKNGMVIKGKSEESRKRTKFLKRKEKVFRTKEYLYND